MISRFIAFSILLFSLFISNTFAQTSDTIKINPELLSNHWKASWITHPSESVLDYGVFHFRKSFDLKSVPSSFVIHISADNRYRLFVNGKAVCFGPSRGDLAHWFYESINIAPYLNSGNNLLAAEVWNFGEAKPWAQFSLKTALIVQGNSPSEEILNTDSSWKVIKNGAYSSASASAKETAGQFVVVGPCDRVEAAKYPWGWETSAFDAANWKSAKTIDTGHPRGVGTDINWVLTPRRIPMMEQAWQRLSTVRRTNGGAAPEGFIQGKEKWVIPANTKITVLFDQGNLTTGYPELLTSNGKGSQVKMTYSESLFDAKGGKGNRNEIEGKKIVGYSDFFLPDGGENRLFRPLWFRTWRYLQFEIETKDKPLTINDFKSEFTAYPLKEKAIFESDNENLKKIWNVGWRTARLCANETYYDCPYYEQLQYVGDTRIQSFISLYVAGDDRLIRNALLDYKESIIYEGLTQSRYPSASTQIIPPFSLYWVDMVHDYWSLRDDPQFVKGFMGGIDQVLGWFNARIDPVTGMLGKVEYWNFVDWAIEWPWISESRVGGVPDGGTVDGNSSILTMQFAYAVQRAAELNEFFGNTSEAAKYKLLARNLTEAVYKNCWDEQKGYLADTPAKKSFSMHAQIFGVLTNTIPEISQKALIAKSIDDKALIQPTMYFRFYLTQALKKTGLADHYLQTLGLWETMLQNGLTTFAENPDPARSDCHAWSASPNYDFLATVAGIRPASPGFRSVQMEPALGSLKFIKGQMPHPMGLIRFDLRKSGADGIEGFVELPDQLTGTFVWEGKSVVLKGKTAIKF
jgi:alpha-L-rhamnosidase